MSDIITLNDGSQYQKPSGATTTGAFLAGGAVHSVASSSGSFLSFPLMGKIRKLNEGIDKVEISNSLKKALEKSELQDKVKLCELTSSNNYKNLKDFYKGILEEIKGGANPLLEMMSMRMSTVEEGFNAMYSPVSNTIMINTEKIGLSGFHEIGHSINFNKGKFWKLMHYGNIAALPTVGVLTLIALLKRKKVDGEKPEGFFDKATTFIKENVGKLSLLATIPMLAEELKASARGNKLAKELLNPEMYKKVVKLNRYGAITYIGTALIVSASAYLANKVRDAIAKPKKIS